MLQVVQPGTGAHAPLVIAYFVADHAALVSGLPPEACVLVDVDNPSGRFVQPPGHGGVDPLDVAVTFARQHAGLGDPSAIVLVGWSAGCEAVREQLRAGAAPDAVLCLDGVAGSIPPTEAQLAPWRSLVARARASEALFVLTHSAMEYTEKLPAGQRFISTTHMAEAVTGTVGITPPAEGAIASADGELFVLAYPSEDIDGPAHIRQQLDVLPDVMQRIVAPWLGARSGAGEPAAGAAPTDPSPVAPASTLPPTVAARPTSPPSALTPVTSRDLELGVIGADVITWERWLDIRGFLGMDAVTLVGSFNPVVVAATRRMQNAIALVIDGVVGANTRAQAKAWPAPMVKGDDGTPAWEESGLSLGARAVRWALQYAGREDLERDGPNASPEIVDWLRPATRRATGVSIGIASGEWCAVFFCASTAAVVRPGERMPHGYRAAGVELRDDAKANGTWREASIVRGGSWLPTEGDGCILQRAGENWETHTCRVVALSSIGFWTVGGNESNTVRLTHRSLSDPELLGFITYA